jgi:pimeloyl-ACP methyl ester carboxylesterase
MEKVISKDGTPIAYHRSGKGAPLVLIHGTGASSERWKPILPALEKQFSIYAVDRRGRGASGDAHAYAMRREFEDVAAVVDSIGDRVHLLGHSFGAICSLEATLLTSHVHKVILYEPPLPVEGAPTYPGRDNRPTSSISRRGRPRTRYCDLHARSGQDAAAPTRTRQSVPSISGPAGCRPHASARTAHRAAIPTRADAFQGRWRANTAAARQRQPKLFQGGYRGRTRRVAEQSNQGATWAATHRHGHCARPVCA